MHGLGTIINTVSVVIFGTIGLFLKKGISQRIADEVVHAIGIAVIFIGISGTLSEMLSVVDGKIAIKGTMLLIISLIIGAFLGEALKIEQHLESFGQKLKTAVKSKDGADFVEGFVTTTLIFCVGAMAIVGSLEDGLTGDFSTLAAKSVLDSVMALIMSSTLGVGVLFSAGAVLVYQGSITLLAEFISPILSDTLVSNLSLVGSALIFAIGVNLLFGKKIKTGNLLPALLIPVVYEVILKLLVPLF